jgi:NOL1/NOP2/fmu family ribosome biogenesis protein
MTITILDKTKKEKFIEQLKVYGITSIPHLVIVTGKEKYRFFSGSLSRIEIEKMRGINLEGIGLYAAKQEGNEIRLTLDGIHLLKEQIRVYFELNDEQAKSWFLGQDIPIKTDKHGFIILKYKGDFIGCGKASNGRITNFMPKERRIKS